eukprot:3934305-Rhodomonas_salina.3
MACNDRHGMTTTVAPHLGLGLRQQGEVSPLPCPHLRQVHLLPLLLFGLVRADCLLERRDHPCCLAPLHTLPLRSRSGSKPVSQQSVQSRVGHEVDVAVKYPPGLRRAHGHIPRMVGWVLGHIAQQCVHTHPRERLRVFHEKLRQPVQILGMDRARHCARDWAVPTVCDEQQALQLADP